MGPRGHVPMDVRGFGGGKLDQAKRAIAFVWAMRTESHTVENLNAAYVIVHTLQGSQ